MNRLIATFGVRGHLGTKVRAMNEDHLRRRRQLKGMQGPEEEPLSVDQSSDRIKRLSKRRECQ